jgi:tetraacyldisaccharide 4'-kinase
MRPFEYIVQIILWARRTLYQVFPARIYHPPLPVLVIGNIFVGGTGKTPVVIALVKGLSDHGWHPGVISRGYGIHIGPVPRLARGDVLANELGDEPALIARQTQAPLAVHPNRRKAIEALMRAHPEVNLIVADDGLQHLAMARDLEIIVQDQRGIGNGRVMPAGPLRESASRMQTVDAIITNLPAGDASPKDQATHNHTDQLPTVRASQMQLNIIAIRHLTDGESLTPEQFLLRMAGHCIAAAAGIGMPTRFFDSLRRAGFVLDQTLALEDHQTIDSRTFSGLKSDLILITAKDAIKCEGLADPRLWVVDVSSSFSDPDFIGWISNRLHQVSRSSYECLQ